MGGEAEGRPNWVKYKKESELIVKYCEGVVLVMTPKQEAQ